eukprot:g7393.t1
MGTGSIKLGLALLVGLVVFSFGLWAKERRIATDEEAQSFPGIGLGYEAPCAAKDAISSVSSGAPQTVQAAGPALDNSDEFQAETFWKEYAADRYNLLLRGARDDGKREVGERVGSGDLGSSNGRQDPTKYLAFAPCASAGLGNHMSGMMSAFALSIATERVFLHTWTEPTAQCGAVYADLFVPPFEPWSASAAAGTRVSGPGRLLVDDHDATGNQESLSGSGKDVGQEHQHGDSSKMGSGSWGGTPKFSSATERQRCYLDLTHHGVASGEFDRVFIDMRGQDPRPDCPVLYVTSNQFFVEVVASAAYGTSLVGDTPLSEWLQVGNISTTLFSGLFRPVASLRQEIAEVSTQLFPSTGQTLAAHARAWHLRDNAVKQTFTECLERWATKSNISTVVLATDIPKFELGESGTTVVSMRGVERTGEGQDMRNTLDKMRNAVVELFLIGKADIAITSPVSAFSALGAASGGKTTQRVGGTSCKPVPNEPEFHMLNCGAGKWVLDYTKWHEKLYDYMHSYLQPWFKADVQSMLDEPDIAALREEKYVGMHIRRTDKIIYDGATFTPTEKYFENAADYLATSPGGLTSMDIYGLWLSTDDDAVLDEVKTLAPKYFPNVKPEDILLVTDRVPVRPMVMGKFDEGATDRNTYEAMVLLRLELQMLAGAEVFSGTFSSNLGRIVCLMRHTLNKPKESALSADEPAWFPGRHK